MGNDVNTWAFTANTNFEHKESKVDAPKFTLEYDAAIGFFRSLVLSNCWTGFMKMTKHELF